MGEGFLITLAIGALFAPDAILIARGLEQRSNNAAVIELQDVQANQIVDGKCVSMLVTCVGDVCAYPEILKHAQAGVNAQAEDIDPIITMAKTSGFYKRCDEYYPMAFRLPHKKIFLTEQGVWVHNN